MLSLLQPKIPTLFAAAGAALAAAAVGLFSLFPGARAVGLLLASVAGLSFWASRPGEGRWLRTPLDVPVFLLLFQMAISFWASAFPEKTWVAICQLGAGLIAYYAVVNWARSRDRLWWTVGALIACGLGLAIIAPFGVDWFRDRKTFLPTALYQYFPLLLSDSVHPNVMAGSLATLIPFPLALLLTLPTLWKRRFWLRGALLTATLLQLLILVLTKSRGGYLALGLGLWLTLWLSGCRRWAIGLTIAAALVIVWLVMRTPAEVGQAVNVAQDALDASTWSFRLDVWHTAIQIIGDSTFTGVGAGTFNEVAALHYGLYAPFNPGAHNLFLQAAVDLGILGLISFLAIQLSGLWIAFQNYRSLDPVREWALRAVAIGTLSSLTATLAHGLVDVHTWGSKGAFIPWMVIGLNIALHGLLLPRSQNPKGREETEDL
jgi:O-antigen ligase